MALVEIMVESADFFSKWDFRVGGYHFVINLVLVKVFNDTEGIICGERCLKVEWKTFRVFFLIVSSES
jgi:hypothetical protein